MEIVRKGVDKAEAMAALKKRALSLAGAACHPDRNVVFGEGDLDAALVIVGEAPGAQEDKLGRPFVGPAGKLLDRMLSDVGLIRESIWITNVVKCRPTNERAGRLSNRPPTPQEVRDWSGILMEELLIISPKVILCAGAVAAKALIRKDFAMLKERGQWFECPLGARTMAAFHPAYIMRQAGAEMEVRVEAFKSDLERAAGFALSR